MLEVEAKAECSRPEARGRSKMFNTHHKNDIVHYINTKLYRQSVTTRQAFISMWQPRSWTDKIRQIYMYKN